MSTPAPDDDWADRLAPILRTCREGAGMSRSRLAWLLETPEQNVKNWETGRSLPSFPHFQKLRKVLPGFDEATRVYLNAGNRRPNAIQLPTVVVVSS